MAAPNVPQSPPEYFPLSQTRVQWTLAIIATLGIFSMWLAGGMSSPAHDAVGMPESTTLLRIDLNSADERELSLLPGVGPVLARRIVNNRQQLGNFGSVEDLDRVHGVGPKTIDRLGDVCEVNREPVK